MDTAETPLDLTYVIVGPPNHSVVVCHRPGDLAKLKLIDWSGFSRLGDNITARVVSEGFSDRNVQFWSEEEWPLHMPLKFSDFAGERERVFVHEFPIRIKPTRFTLPELSPDMLAELGPITDYLLTYNAETEQFGLRMRDLTPEQKPFWFMARLAR